MSVLHRMIVVEGRVQGVGYRNSAMLRARELGLQGTACNLSTGAVELHVEGDEKAIETYTDWARKGPMLAHVTAVHFSDGPVQGFTGTIILR